MKTGARLRGEGGGVKNTIKLIRTCNYQKIPAYSEIISISLSTKGDKVLRGFN